MVSGKTAAAKNNLPTRRYKRLLKMICREITSAQKFTDYYVLESECQHILDKALQQLSPQGGIVFSVINCLIVNVALNLVCNNH